MTTVEEIIAAGWRCPERINESASFLSRRCGSATNPRKVDLYTPGGYPFQKPNSDWRCGKHAAMHERRAAKGQEREKSHAAARQARKETNDRRSYATNVALMLAQAIAAKSNLVGVHFDVTHDGRELTIDVESAEKLMKWLAS